MSLNGLSTPAVNEALNQALVEAGGWFLLKYISRDVVELLGRGKGGVHEARTEILKYTEASPLYGLIIYRRRKILIKYIPDGTSRLLQARTAVHFQDVSDRFSPYETLLEIATADELNDTSLASSFPLHTASPAASSNRLHEISEDGEDSNGQMPRRPAVQSYASTGQIFGTQRYKMEKRVDQLMGPDRPRMSTSPSRSANENMPTLPAPLSPPQKTSISQYLVRDDHGRRSVRSLGMHQPTEFVGSNSFQRNADPISGLDDSSSKPAMDHGNISPLSELERPIFSRGESRTSSHSPESVKSKSPERPVEHANGPERPIISEPRKHEEEPYDWSRFDPKQKVRLGPRPVAPDERLKRPTVAPVSTIPSILRPTQKRQEPSRPKSFGPSSAPVLASATYMRPPPLPHSALPMFIQPPPIPYTPEYSPKSVSGGSIKSSTSRKSTTMTPDKVRLMKAVELRKKQLRKSSPQQSFTPPPEEVPAMPERASSPPTIPQRSPERELKSTRETGLDRVEKQDPSPAQSDVQKSSEGQLEPAFQYSAVPAQHARKSLSPEANPRRHFELGPQPSTETRNVEAQESLDAYPAPANAPRPFESETQPTRETMVNRSHQSRDSYSARARTQSPPQMEPQTARNSYAARARTQSPPMVEPRTARNSYSAHARAQSPPKIEPQSVMDSYSVRARAQSPPQVESRTARERSVIRAQQSRKPDSGIEMEYEELEPQLTQSSVLEPPELMSSRFSTTSSNEHEDEVVHKEGSRASRFFKRMSHLGSADLSLHKSTKH